MEYELFPALCTLIMLNSVVLFHYVFFRSLDVLLGKVKRNSPVPLWNYFILQFQIFLLYFFAGLKKMDKEWLDGYSMRNLGNHWIFEPFK
jgi:vitamin K-dependent gamma-carboxylase